MPEKTYKLVELVGVSEISIDEAIRNAITRAGQSLKRLDWFEVTEIRGLVTHGAVSEFQTTLKLGFRIMSDEELRGA